MSDPRRQLPGVDVLLTSPSFQPLLDRFPRSRVVESTRKVLEGLRTEVAREANRARLPDEETYARLVESILEALALPSLRPVVNATGVVLHTNLGRAPLSGPTRKAMARAGHGYSNLEFDLGAGERGSRYVHCVGLLKELTGAPDALVVNNNAAAVVLALNTLAVGRRVLVSRGELVEIGGGFRIPEMLARSGAFLSEVGTTNRTRIEDYRRAVEEAREAEGAPVGAILKVHRSNFRISGFTEEASLAELGALARELDLSLLHDLGSGLLADPRPLGLPEEPRAPESIAAGAHAVAISGDKLLGGPQAGILLGREGVIDAMRKNPLCRAFRVDKVTLAGLEATLRHYLDPAEALREIPVLRMLSISLDALEARARDLASRLHHDGASFRVAPGKGVVGGGTYPGVELPSWTVRVRARGEGPQELAKRLRSRALPVVARVEDDELVLDLRTVEPEEEGAVATALLECLDEGP